MGADFDEAIDRFRKLRTEHDKLLARLEDPDEFQNQKAETRRDKENKYWEEVEREETEYETWCHERGLKTETEEYLEEEAKLIAKGVLVEETPWKRAESWLETVEHERMRSNPPSHEQLARMRKLLVDLELDDVNVQLAPFQEYKDLVEGMQDIVKGRVNFQTEIPTPMDNDEYHDRLVEIHAPLVGEDIQPPTDPEERDSFDCTKLKLERRIARVALNPDTISKVAAKFYSFAELRKPTEDKYDRTIKRIIKKTGDIPLSQVTPRMLRDYRDHLKNKKRPLLPSSIRAEFTPIMGMFNYAVDEEIIENSPMVSVKLPKERHAVEEMKWLPFDIEETERIFKALNKVWGHPVRGLSDERREALSMSVRVLAYTAMRPAELMALRSDQVDERAIRVEGGKTKSSWRVIPLHPKIADFPDWLHSGKLDAFFSSKTGQAQTDPVTVLRHNFSRLIRHKMDDPIIDRREALYSLRSTFQNSMRRAGAPKDVRRAILGHVESGAIRHYDDGPSFELLKKWVERADPRR